MNESVFACDMSVFEPSVRLRHLENTKKIFQNAEEINEIYDGYSFAFPNDSETLVRLMEFVDKERLCCPFLGFIIEVEPENGKAKLQLYGGEGVKEFIKAEAENYSKK